MRRTVIGFVLMFACALWARALVNGYNPAHEIATFCDYLKNVSTMTAPQVVGWTIGLFLVWSAWPKQEPIVNEIKPNCDCYKLVASMGPVRLNSQHQRR